MNVEISEENSKYMYNFIKNIIKECGPRMPCCSAEAKGAEIIRKEMEKTCDEVVIEPFKCHPRAFLGFLRISISFLISSFVLFLFLPILAPTSQITQLFIMIIDVSLNIIGVWILWKEFFNYQEYIDPIFKEKSSQNVVGKIKAKDELKKILIFSGHHDSALQFNLLRYLWIGYGIVLFWGLGATFLWVFLSTFILIAVILGFGFVFIYHFVFWFFISSLFPTIALWFFVSRGEKANKVPGAVDNISAVAIVLGLGKYLQKHKEIIPKNTEIRLISFGCEEAGLRGAYRYTERHLEELKKCGAEIINMDSIFAPNNIFAFVNEPTTRTKHSPEVIQKIKEAADLVGVDINTVGDSISAKTIGIISGGSDAAAFSKAKIKAASISAVKLSSFIKLYHQPTDDIDKISEEALVNVLKICIGYLINERGKK